MPAKRAPAAPVAAGARTTGLHTCMAGRAAGLRTCVNMGCLHAGAFLYQPLHDRTSHYMRYHVNFPRQTISIFSFQPLRYASSRRSYMQLLKLSSALHVLAWAHVLLAAMPEMQRCLITPQCHRVGMGTPAPARPRCARSRAAAPAPTALACPALRSRPWPVHESNAHIQAATCTSTCGALSMSMP